MGYKFDFSSRPNRLVLAIGIALIIGSIAGNINEKKICTSAIDKRIEVKCGYFVDEDISYEYNWRKRPS